MFETDQRFYRNDEDELMVTIKVADFDNMIHGETQIMKYNEQELKNYLESLNKKYSNIRFDWDRIMKEKEYFLSKELDRSLTFQ